MLRRAFISCFTALLLVVSGMPAAAASEPFATALARGVAAREAGNLTLAIDTLRLALAAAANPAQRQQGAAELGAALLQSRQFELAEPPLRLAYDSSRGKARAAHALVLGNLALQKGQPEFASLLYLEAQTLAGPGSAIAARATLNGALRGPALPIAALEQIYTDIGSSGASADLYLSLAHQARRAQAGALAHRALQKAQALATGREQVETLDALAQLYEDAQRSDEAIALSRQALALSGAADLAIPLESRLGRLYKLKGEGALSLAAYQRATVHVETLRPDIPIEFDDGTTSFHGWFEPVYLGLAAGLIDAASASPAQAQPYLRRARDAVELVKQSELQDYLGDRCTVDSVKGGSATVIPKGTAVLYTIVLPDRIELLLETAGGIAHFRSRAPGADVRLAAANFAAELRSIGPGYMARARQLYDWLLRPLEASLAAHGIDTLVVVPDGALRLVPFGALHDGTSFAIDRMAFATVTGMTMTNTTAPARSSYRALVAGASEFGPVVDKLLQTRIGQKMDAELAARGGARAVGPQRRLREIGGATTSDDRTERMREALALPGVASEVARVSTLLGTSAILDARFTVRSFSGAVQGDNYGIVHLASHGMFGGSGSSSFVLAYDDLLTLDRLQDVLRAERYRRHPIELLTLSACETAEGNERAPLGMSGAAMKARAKSVLGALWPVEDQAAVTLMTRFYGGMTKEGRSKAQSLQGAQRALKDNPDLAHPGFWAPFTLIGNWL